MDDLIKGQSASATTGNLGEVCRETSAWSAFGHSGVGKRANGTTKRNFPGSSPITQGSAGATRLPPPAPKRHAAPRNALEPTCLDPVDSRPDRSSGRERDGAVGWADWGGRGRCRSGTSLTACHYFMKGRCKKGDACPFLHAGGTVDSMAAETLLRTSGLERPGGTARALTAITAEAVPILGQCGEMADRAGSGAMLRPGGLKGRKEPCDTQQSISIPHSRRAEATDQESWADPLEDVAGTGSICERSGCRQPGEGGGETGRGSGEEKMGAADVLANTLTLETGAGEQMDKAQRQPALAAADHNLACPAAASASVNPSRQKGPHIKSRTHPAHPVAASLASTLTPLATPSRLRTIVPIHNDGPDTSRSVINLQKRSHRFDRAGGGRGRDKTTTNSPLYEQVRQCLTWQPWYFPPLYSWSSFDFGTSTDNGIDARNFADGGGWGLCDAMCPEVERNERLYDTKDINLHHETRPDNLLPDAAWMITMFHRNDAGRAAPGPSFLRPVALLATSVEHLVTVVLERQFAASPPFYSVSHFVSARLRQIRQELTMQHDSFSVEARLCAVDILEICTRFHIMVEHRCCELGIRNCSLNDVKFDSKMNMNMYTQALAGLQAHYDSFRDLGIPCPNEAECQAYFVLSAGETEVLTGKLAQMPTRILAAPAMQRALRVIGAIGCSDFVSFFRELKAADYLTACLMHRHFDVVRETALAAINRAFRPPVRGSASQLPLVKLVRMLCLEGLDEAQQLCYHFQLELSRAGDAVTLQGYPHARLDAEGLVVPLPLICSHSFIEKKREGIRMSELLMSPHTPSVLGGSVPALPDAPEGVPPATQPAVSVPNRLRVAPRNQVVLPALVVPTAASANTAPLVIPANQSPSLMPNTSSGATASPPWVPAAAAELRKRFSGDVVTQDAPAALSVCSKLAGAPIAALTKPASLLSPLARTLSPQSGPVHAALSSGSAIDSMGAPQPYSCSPAGVSSLLPASHAPSGLTSTAPVLRPCEEETDTQNMGWSFCLGENESTAAGNVLGHAAALDRARSAEASALLAHTIAVVVYTESRGVAAAALDYLAALEHGAKSAHPPRLLAMAADPDSRLPLLWFSLGKWKSAAASGRRHRAAFAAKRAAQRDNLLAASVGEHSTVLRDERRRGSPSLPGWLTSDLPISSLLISVPHTTHSQPTPPDAATVNFPRCTLLPMSTHSLQPDRLRASTASSDAEVARSVPAAVTSHALSPARTLDSRKKLAVSNRWVHPAAINLGAGGRSVNVTAGATDGNSSPAANANVGRVSRAKERLKSTPLPLPDASISFVESSRVPASRALHELLWALANVRGAQQVTDDALARCCSGVGDASCSPDFTEWSNSHWH